MYITPDHDIEVNYYRVHEGSALHEAITGYHNLCSDFVQRVEALVDKYKADSAYHSGMHDTFNMSVSGLNFTDENAPLNWYMDRFGHFTPHYKSEAIKDFDIELPGFQTYCQQAPAEIKFGNLGNVIIISVPPNKDGSVCNVKDADLLDEESLNALKVSAPPEDVEHLKKLGRYYWAPAPLLRTEVFKPSEEVIKLNEERFNCGFSRELAFKHSHSGRMIRRALQYLGL